MELIIHLHMFQVHFSLAFKILLENCVRAEGVAATAGGAAATAGAKAAAAHAGGRSGRGGAKDGGGE